MSMKSAPGIKIDQKEYLRKYLSNKTKKKKKHHKNKDGNGLKIIDDDNFTHTSKEIDEDILYGGEDAPQIVGEYLEDAQQIAAADKWRSIDGEAKKELIKRDSDDDKWGKPAKYQIEQSAKKNKGSSKISNKNGARKASHDSDSDQSPLRRSDKSSGNRKVKREASPESMHSDLSPPRKTDNSFVNRKVKREATPESMDSDLSPPRKTNNSFVNRKVKRETNPENTDSDQSPPRKTNKSFVNRKIKREASHDNGRGDQSPPRKFRKSSVNRKETSKNNEDSDNSPPRKRAYRSSYHKTEYHGKSPRHRRNSDYTPPSSSDDSGHTPPRSLLDKHSASQKKHEKYAINKRDRSPMDRNERNRLKYSNDRSDSGNTPPRPNERRSEHRNGTKSYKISRSESNSGYTPPRNPPDGTFHRRGGRDVNRMTKSHYRNDCNQSPPRKHDLNYRRQEQRSNRRSNSSSNQDERYNRRSPKRRPEYSSYTKDRNQDNSPLPDKHDKYKHRSSDSPPPSHKPKATRTLEGKKAGLQDAQSLVVENDERRRKEDRLFNEMSKEVSGRDADVRVRSTGRRGQRGRDAEAEDPEVRRRKEEHEKKKQEQYDRWGKGLKQIEDHKALRAEELHESNKPLARYSNDQDLDQYLRQQERLDDPMLEYMRGKNKERMKKEKVPVKPIYEGTFPENRYSIRPGYRWDGVDRSNGYEKKWFNMQNEKVAVEEEAYKFSVEDM